MNKDIHTWAEIWSHSFKVHKKQTKSLNHPYFWHPVYFLANNNYSCITHAAQHFHALMHLRIIKQCDILEENNGRCERNQMKSELTNRFVFNPIPTDHPLTCLQTAQMIYFAYTRLNNTFRTAFDHWGLTVYSCLKSRLQKK